MDTRDILQRELERIERRLEELDRYPREDPYKDGTVLTFKRSFPNETSAVRTYKYAAVRARGRYYTTAVNDPQGGRSWTQFVQWLSERGETGPLHVMIRKDKADRAASITAPRFNRDDAVIPIEPPSAHLMLHLVNDHKFEGLGLLSGTMAGELHRLDHNRPNSPVTAHESQYTHAEPVVDAAFTKELYEDLMVLRTRLTESEQIHLDRVLSAAEEEPATLAAARRRVEPF